MSNYVFHSLAQVSDISGNVSIAPGADVTVTNATIGGLASLTSDFNGLTPIANPTVADSEGRIEFYAPAGRYDILVSDGVNSLTWNDVNIGTTPDQLGVNSVWTTELTGAAYASSTSFSVASIPVSEDGSSPLHVGAAVRLWVSSINDYLYGSVTAISSLTVTLDNICDNAGIAGTLSNVPIRAWAAIDIGRVLNPWQPAEVGVVATQYRRGDPRRYGAVSGVVSTSAIQAAVNAVIGVGAVYLPYGVWIGYVNVSSNTVIYGEGANSILKIPNGANRPAIQPLDTAAGADYVQLRNFCINGNEPNNDNNAHGIFADGQCDAWKINNVKQVTVNGNAIRVRGSGSAGATAKADDFVISDCDLYHCGLKSTGATGRDSIYINGGQSFRITNNIVDYAGRQGIAFEGSAAESIATRKIICTGNIVRNAISGGIDDEANNGGQMIISNNYIEECPGTAIRLSGDSNDSVASSNIIRNCGNGIDATNSQVIQSSLVISDNVLDGILTGVGIKANISTRTIISGNNLNAVKTIGIYLSGNDNTSPKVINNIISKSEQEAIVISGYGQGLHCSGNSVIDCGVSGAPANAIAIYTTSGSNTWNYSVITDNIVIDTRSPAYITNAFYFGYLANTVISGNVVKGAVTKEVYWINASPSTNISIYNNVWNTANWGGAAEPSSYFRGEAVPVFGQHMVITDGMTAPATSAGFGKIYIDTTDGDLKIKYGDGTVKTIVVDT